MSAREVLRNPEVCPSAAWKAAVYLWGPEVRDWEPDVFRFELERKGVHATAQLMAKLLGAQTVVAHTRWLSDHVVFFAFCLACTGVAPVPGLPQHPTPEELAWGVEEMKTLRPELARRMPDEGFDPDEIDPAVAVVLVHDGWFVAPKELDFADDCVRDEANMEDEDDSHAKVDYDSLMELRDLIAVADESKLKAVSKGLGESAANVTASRLIDCRRHLDALRALRAVQHADAVR